MKRVLVIAGAMALLAAPALAQGRTRTAPTLPPAAGNAPSTAPGQQYIGSQFQQGPGYVGGPGDYRGASGYAPGMSFGAGSPPPRGASGVAPGRTR